MGLLSRLFRGSGRRSVSKLDEFLSMIDRETIPARAKEVKSPELRLATTLSLLVLEQSGRFTRELFDAPPPGAHWHLVSHSTVVLV
jgi:hypothetical protein